MEASAPALARNRNEELVRSDLTAIFGECVIIAETSLCNKLFEHAVRFLQRGEHSQLANEIEIECSLEETSAASRAAFLGKNIS